MRSMQYARFPGLAIAACLLAACSALGAPNRTDSPASGPASPETSASPTWEMSAEELADLDPAALGGSIAIAGSSTVYPLSEHMAERFQGEGFAGEITIDSIGTGAGFERFCVTGETDLVNASRAIQPEELQACAEIGRQPIEFRVGVDALAVVASLENTFLSDLSLEQLALVFSSAAEWSEVEPSWPAETILRFSPGTDSGTFDYFVEAVFAGEEAPLLNAANLQLSEDDNVLVRGVAGSPFAIGYFGYAYYQENSASLKALSIEGVAPSAGSVENGQYPLARPLFLYSDATVMKEKPQVARFIHFYLEHASEDIAQVGYFPAGADSRQQALEDWLDALK